ncbi:MAG: GumC family protein [Ferruginibacter sp.]
MSFIYFIKLLFKNLRWLILIPSVLAITIFYFTRGEKKVYSSESVIYTGIASGYSLSGNVKADFYTTSNAFDNLLSLITSRETKQEVAVNLLAKHLMLKKHEPDVLSWGAFDELKKSIPDSVRKLVVASTEAETVQRLKKYMTTDDDNLIYKIINSGNPFYSLSALNNIKAARISNSDLIKISYETNDAVICKTTLELLEEAFMRKHRLLKEGQSESVVDYFEKETKMAYGRLDSAELAFLEFNKNNDIINYYEQTKAVAGEREDLYAMNHNLEMDQSASTSSLKTVNESIKGRMYQTLYGTDILRDKEKLSEVYNKIAVKEVLGKNDPVQMKELDSLKKSTAALEKNLNTSVNNLYLQSNTPNGIPTKSVLDEWIKSTLAYEQSKARLGVMDKRKKEFQEEYRRFAPLGAMLKKIERQIGVSEQEYLQLLHGLNMAKLTQQNNELTTKLNIVDPPYLPLKPNASKRMVLVIVGFMVGFIFVLAFLLARALVSKAMHQPDAAAKSVDIPLLGIYPLLKESKQFLAKSDVRLYQQFLSRIDIKKKPLFIGFISNQSKEGKTTISDILYRQLIASGYTVDQLAWQQNSSILIQSKADFVFIEFPALENTVIQPGHFPALDNVYLICRSNRIWTRIDKNILSMFTRVTSYKPALILNGVDAIFAEEFIGEVPKKRTGIRSFIKRIVKFEFGNRRKFV